MVRRRCKNDQQDDAVCEKRRASCASRSRHRSAPRLAVSTVSPKRNVHLRLTQTANATTLPAHVALVRSVYDIADIYPQPTREELYALMFHFYMRTLPSFSQQLPRKPTSLFSQNCSRRDVRGGTRRADAPGASGALRPGRPQVQQGPHGPPSHPKRRTFSACRTSTTSGVFRRPAGRS